MIWFSGKDDKHESGVGFLANKEIVSAVLECTPVLESSQSE